MTGISRADLLLRALSPSSSASDWTYRLGFGLQFYDTHGGGWLLAERLFCMHLVSL